MCPAKLGKWRTLHPQSDRDASSLPTTSALGGGRPWPMGDGLPLPRCGKGPKIRKPILDFRSRADYYGYHCCCFWFFLIKKPTSGIRPTSCVKFFKELCVRGGMWGLSGNRMLRSQPPRLPSTRDVSFKTLFNGEPLAIASPLLSRNAWSPCGTNSSSALAPRSAASTRKPAPTLRCTHNHSRGRKLGRLFSRRRGVPISTHPTTHQFEYKASASIVRGATWSAQARCELHGAP